MFISFLPEIAGRLAGSPAPLAAGQICTILAMLVQPETDWSSAKDLTLLQSCPSTVKSGPTRLIE
jgi:hypothetical protein